MSDNHAAGATAGRLMGRFSDRAPGKVLVIAETMLARDSLERRLGFDHVINTDYPHLSVLPSLETYGDMERTEQVIRSAFNGHDNIAGIYILGSEARLPLEIALGAAKARKPVVIAHERTPFTEAALQSRQIDALITQDPGHLVRSAIRILRARKDRREILSSQEKIRIEILIKENIRNVAFRTDLPARNCNECVSARVCRADEDALPRGLREARPQHVPARI